MPAKKVAVFGGTFDPIHNGHVMLANYVVLAGLADEVWLMVSPCNPLKRDSHITADEIRLEMARAACRGLNGVLVSDFEFGLERPSYTARTLGALAEAYPDIDLSLLVGSDNWLCFDSWREPRKILSLARLLIYPRPGYDASARPFPSGAEAEGIKCPQLIADAPTAEISSTFIRHHLARGADLRGFIPESVAEIIRSRSLYNSSFASCSATCET